MYTKFICRQCGKEAYGVGYSTDDLIFNTCLECGERTETKEKQTVSGPVPHGYKPVEES